MNALRNQTLAVLVVMVASGASHAQSILSPDAAKASVRKFVGQGALQFFVSPLNPHWEHGYCEPVYTLSAPNRGGDEGVFDVSAASGRVLMMGLPSPEDHYGPKELPPRISFEQAIQLAWQFVKEKAPHLMGRNWVLTRFTNRSTINSNYHLSWFELIGPYNALSPWDLDIDVDSQSGAISYFLSPPDTPIVCPTVPRVSLEQALAMAARINRYPLDRAPFRHTLQLEERRDNGIQRLVWFLYQSDPRDPDSEWRVVFDALTGDFIRFEAPLGMGGGKAVRPPQGPPPAPVTIRGGGGGAKPVGDGRTVKLDGGETWIRAELLRPLGGYVELTKAVATLYDGARRIPGDSVGAKWRDAGWWVPLRRTSEALGWSLAWSSAEHAITVDTTKR